ncbi:hypothetical protein [Thermococcus sp. GR6]|uniref:hypothetical protein n=1 Tax=Thermococcus sp. GR6 TaxID=1638256 RepID=UPI00143117AB|nr:hypothetical protein [Thermococcus sp. GR6]NJE41839.1 hypothetical protein [Thermococcus sp. GR6]
MGRKRKYGVTKIVSVSLDKKIADEIEEKKGRLSWGDFITQLYIENRDKAELIIEIELLKRKIESLELENSELKRQIEQLESQLEKLKSKQSRKTALKKATDDALEKLYRALEDKRKIKVLEALRILGYQESGEALQKRAREFINSLDELNLAVEKKENVGLLGWLVFKKPAP